MGVMGALKLDETNGSASLDGYCGTIKTLGPKDH